MAENVTLTVIDQSSSIGVSVSNDSAMVVMSVTESAQSVTLTVTDPVQSPAKVSAQQDNRLKMLADGLHVLDELIPDPLAYYILAKG